MSRGRLSDGPRHSADHGGEELAERHQRLRSPLQIGPQIKSTMASRSLTSN